MGGKLGGAYNPVLEVHVADDWKSSSIGNDLEIENNQAKRWLCQGEVIMYADAWRG